MEIRTLRADEIECRVQQVKNNGCSLLLYKDARCDMRILDEVFGILGWEREHQVIDGNLYCTIRVWDESHNRWVSKQDVGTESMTEKEKGQASDSFKRACFNLGIGRELYSSPFIWIKLNQDEVDTDTGRPKLNFGVKFYVKEIEYSNTSREITKLVIVDKKDNIRFKMVEKINTPNKDTQTKKTNTISRVLTADQLEALFELGRKAGFNTEIVRAQTFKKFNKEPKDLDLVQYKAVVNGYNNVLKKSTQF